MWLGKFLDIEKDLKSLTSEIRKQFKEVMKREKLTPLEFTILESIFNRRISGYDLIQKLNKHFAGTWEAQSGTVYPILSKLKKAGFLDSKEIRSPVGPLKKVYILTKAGEDILKYKVNENFLDQLKFMENFLIELSTIYIHSFLNIETDKELARKKVKEVQDLLNMITENVIRNLPNDVIFKQKCSECDNEFDRDGATYCSYCGAPLFNADKKDNLL